MSSNRRSSRSSGGSSEVSEKRSAAYEPEVIEGIGELNNNYSRKVFKISTDEMKNQKELSMIGVEFPKPSIKESDSYYKMSEDQRNKCCRLVVRLLLMKAARNESVTRAVVADVLASFDPIYKKHVSVVISEAKVILSATFGYNLLCGSQISLNGRRDEFYLVNELDSPTLYAVLAESRKINDNAFVGFVYVILQIIFSSPGRKCDVRTLLRNVRKIDNRFPEMVVKGKDKSTAISELEVDFLSLLARMKKEGYITLDKVLHLLFSFTFKSLPIHILTRSLTTTTSYYVTHILTTYSRRILWMKLTMT